MTKIVSKASDKTVVANRVKFLDGDLFPLLMAPFASAFVSLLSTAGVMDIFFTSTDTAFAIAGTVAAVSIPASVAVVHSHTVAKQLKDYTGTSISKMGKLKIALSMMLPVGHRIQTGKTGHNLSGRAISANLVGGRDSIHSGYYGSRNEGDSTHEVTTELVFNPHGAYIKQTMIAEPTKVWDDAFESTVSVHKFRTPKAVNSKLRSRVLEDAPF